MLKKRNSRDSRDSGNSRDKKGSKKFGKSKFPRKKKFIFKKKKCKFCVEKKLTISHLNQQLLRKFVTERGKIIPSRFSGACAKHQRKLTKAIKRARNAGLLPFLAE